jgi:hypothetical protein
LNEENEDTYRSNVDHNYIDWFKKQRSVDEQKKVEGIMKYNNEQEIRKIMMPLKYTFK